MQRTLALLGFAPQIVTILNIVLLSMLFKAIVLIPLCHRWVKYGKLLNLMLHPLHLEIGLRWYQNKNESNWAYASKDQTIMKLRIVIALDLMGVQP